MDVVLWCLEVGTYGPPPVQTEGEAANPGLGIGEFYAEHLQCPYCMNYYSYQSTLSTHVREKHGAGQSQGDAMQVLAADGSQCAIPPPVDSAERLALKRWDDALKRSGDVLKRARLTKPGVAGPARSSVVDASGLQRSFTVVAGASAKRTRGAVVGCPVGGDFGHDGMSTSDVVCAFELAVDEAPVELLEVPVVDDSDCSFVPVGRGAECLDELGVVGPANVWICSANVTPLATQWGMVKHMPFHIL